MSSSSSHGKDPLLEHIELWGRRFLERNSHLRKRPARQQTILSTSANQPHEQPSNSEEIASVSSASSGSISQKQTVDLLVDPILLDSTQQSVCSVDEASCELLNLTVDQGINSNGSILLEFVEEFDEDSDSERDQQEYKTATGTKAQCSSQLLKEHQSVSNSTDKELSAETGPTHMTTTANNSPLAANNGFLVQQQPQTPSPLRPQPLPSCWACFDPISSDQPWSCRRCRHRFHYLCYHRQLFEVPTNDPVPSLQPCLECRLNGRQQREKAVNDDDILGKMLSRVEKLEADLVVVKRGLAEEEARREEKKLGSLCWVCLRPAEKHCCLGVFYCGEHCWAKDLPRHRHSCQKLKLKATAYQDSASR